MITTEAVNKELSRSKEKFEAWTMLSPLERAATLERMENLLQSKKDRLATLYQFEITKLLENKVK